MPVNPRISVITPAFNSEHYIENALDSVNTQSYNDYEHLVVDGGSTDRTVDILESYPDVEYVSENDDGLYDALNKGIEMADGEYVCWLNSDDQLTGGALSSLVSALRERPGAEFVVGNAEVVRDESDEQVLVRLIDFTPPGHFEQGEILHDGTAICGSLISRSLLDDIGKFDASYEIAADTEFLYQLASAGTSTAKTEDVVYRYRAHDESLTFGEGPLDETWRVAAEEVLEVVQRFLRDPETPDPLRFHCKEKYRAKATMLLYYHVRSGNLRETASLLRRVFGFDTSWPAWALRTYLRRYV